MKIVTMFGGNAIAVYDSDAKMAKARQLLDEDRVTFIAPAVFTDGSEIFEIVKATIDKVKADSEYDKLRHKVQNFS